MEKKKEEEIVAAVCRRYRSIKGRRTKTRNRHKLKKAQVLKDYCSFISHFFQLFKEYFFFHYYILEHNT